MELLPLIRQLKVIEKETGAFLPFPIDHRPGADFGWAQRQLVAEVERQYNSGDPVRIIVLKARQLGLSTVTTAITFLWAMIFDNFEALILTHENDTTQSLFEKTQSYWENSPFNGLFQAKHSTQRRLVWSNGSSIRTATAGNRNAGVGRTIRSLHTSEASRYPEPEELMGALRQALPKVHGTIEIVESTARGIGNWFHDEWQRAVEGDTSYAPLFFPWYKHYEYSSAHVGMARGLLPTQRPDQLDEEERRLLRLGATYEHLEWRRWVIPNELNFDEDFFMQEYPATPEEAFLSSGTNIFNLSHVRNAYVPVGSAQEDGRQVRAGVGDLHSLDGHRHPEFISAPDGKLTVYRAPSRRPDPLLYEIAVDPTRTTYGDPGCVQVINRATMEQVAVWHGHPDPNEMARVAQTIGRWYHNGQIIVDVGGGGSGVVSLLIQWGYPNMWRHRQADRVMKSQEHAAYGFSATYDRKAWAVGALQYALGKGFLTFHDDKTLHQLQNYIQIGGWEMGNGDSNGHDDAVFALILAVYGSMTEEPYAPPEYRLTTDSGLELFQQHGA